MIGNDAHSPGAPDFSLVLACYNEAPVFEASVERIFRVLDATRFSWEIVFVDDGSQDGTRDLIDGLIGADRVHCLRRIFHERNVGRGGTVADGIRAARGQVVGYIDIDLEVHARYIPACILAVRNGADIAVGRRHNRFRMRALPRILLSRGYMVLVKQVLGVSVDDTESGFKFFRRERILPLLDEIVDTRWFWDTELMVRACRKGYRIEEIPCLFVRRFDKPSTVNVFADSVEYLRKLWQFRKILARETDANEKCP